MIGLMLHGERMSAAQVEELLRLVQLMDAAAGEAGDVASQAVAALDLVRAVEDGLSSRRDDAIRSLYDSGESLQAIRARTGLSRARIHQIVQHHP